MQIITSKFCNCKSILLFLLLFFAGNGVALQAQENQAMRRPISTVSPAWLIHIDVWVNADPKKIIEIVPADIRPFVIFNISLSVSEPNTGPYGPNVDRISILESWIRTCAEYGVWATIQTASGYKQALPDTHTPGDIYEYFYKTYPNFIGYNYAEQCWGFPSEAHFDERLRLLADLIKLGNKYGGYVVQSNAQTMNAPQNNAVAMLKRSRSFRGACKLYPENYITLEKYTTSRGFYDVESTCLGAYLTGYAGNYGIRFDDCGWTMWGARSKKHFPDVLGIIPTIEHALFTGQTVVDGPELTWTIAIGADGTQQSADGYRSKRFKQFPNFTNNNLDYFRKAIDGSFRIPTRQEVIERSKVLFVNDATTGDNRNMYSTERTLFTGLYAVDGEWDQNNNWTKRSGRYPTIPTGFSMASDDIAGFGVVVNKANFNARWGNIANKVNEFNALFPEEYTGDIYASRIKNTWMTYNPYMQDSVAGTPLVLKNTPASGVIPFKYNTCEKMEVIHSNYALAVINEYADKLNVYLNNFTEKVSDEVPLIRTNTIKIYGSTQKPTYTYSNRGDNRAGAVNVTDSWENGVYTINVSHNGPVELDIQCAGTYTARSTDYPAPRAMQTPIAPPAYMGPRQYEGEDFEYKNIAGVALKNATIARYTALGYIMMGNSASASIRQTVSVPETGTYTLKTKYCSPAYTLSTQVHVYVDGVKAVTPVFEKTTSSEWNVNVVDIPLKAGNNVLEFRMSATAGALHIDNIIIEGNVLSHVNKPSVDNAHVLYEEFFTITGQKIGALNNALLKGVFIIKSHMSDGTKRSRKVMY